MAESLFARAEASATYGALGDPQRAIILKAVEVMEQAAEPLDLEELDRRMRGVVGREALQDALPGLLERYGLFRRDAERRWSLAPAELLLQSIDAIPACVVDVEATGGRPPLHRILELGAVRLEAGDDRESRFSSLVDPGRPIPPYISHMLRIRQGQLDSSPPIGEVLPELHRLLDGALLVAHDVSGDVELINYEVHRHEGRFLSNPVVCTVVLSRELWPEMERTGLEHVARELGIQFDQVHRALADAEVTARVWKLQREALRQRGVATLLDLSCFQGYIGAHNFLESRISVERIAEAPPGPGIFRLVDSRGRLLHVEAVDDLASSVRACFYPRSKLPGNVRRAVRSAMDLQIETFATRAEAERKLAGERSATRGDARRTTRRRRRR